MHESGRVTSEVAGGARIAYAAAHVVCRPGDPRQVDWDATLRFREHIWSTGLGVAEAMDTAQRGMGLTWDDTAELVRRSSSAARLAGARIVCGAGTDQLVDLTGVSMDDVVAAYVAQLEVIEGEGVTSVVMASRALARCARSADDYIDVYKRIISQLQRPCILHWLGDMFDPQLAGYWGSSDLDVAADTVIGLIEDHAEKVDGIKVSLLDAQREVDLRRRLPHGVRLYTGDDFNYVDLIKGDATRHSDALLGIFDALAPVAARALAALAGGRVDEYEQLLLPTVPLARHIFEPPTQYYKVGLVFLAYLNGHQDHFRMLDSLEQNRSVDHLARLVPLAAQAGVLDDPERAGARARAVLGDRSPA